MSQKITAKNLAYDSSLPPFLAALQAQAAGATGPDPLIAARRRHAKARSGSAEAEDAPVVVDEHGNEVDVGVAADGTLKQAIVPEAKEPSKTGEPPREEVPAKEVDKVAGIGALKKRKAARVVGEDDDPDGRSTRKDEVDRVANAKSHEKGARDKVRKKPKKIKLSFDGDGDGD